MRRFIALLLAFMMLVTISPALAAQGTNRPVQAETFFERYNRMVSAINDSMGHRLDPWWPVFHTVPEAPDLLLTKTDLGEFEIDLSLFGATGVIRQLIFRVRGEDYPELFYAHLTCAMFALSQGDEDLGRLDAMSFSMGGLTMEMMMRWRLRVNNYQQDIVEAPAEGGSPVYLFVFRYMEKEPKAGDVDAVKSLEEYNSYFEGLAKGD